ncbi:efflux RND transporter periplasmic adaptor subunit [Roseomonas sp. HJA6]|uniref:Efflux RND transporter periplasmic adaptor subunit n=1 Tax=Roseomonas alba TaxID=2846776 RepID=A0ABS7AA15_9PROT|nr:efflux RND transporter periplasmic adaptor subunit [Neoroseomonas alba]MBW6399111.1 efflux RND transporter periplasmic adaptor subunit [Neoroseomonas alba]
MTGVAVGRMRGKGGLLAALGIVGALGLPLVACEKSDAPPQQAAVPPAVFVMPVARQSISPTVEFIGRVEAIDKVDVRARVTAFLVTRHFTEGDMVKAGEVLFTLEQPPFAAEVALRQAQVERAEAEYRNATLQVQRGRDLVRTNNIPQSTLDERIAAEGEAKGNLDAARAQLEQAQIQYGYTEIRVPFDGRAGRSPLSPGNLVGPDSGVLVTVVREDPIRLTFPVTQRELLQVRRDGPEAVRREVKVRARLPDGTLMPEAGRIEFIDVAANRSTDSVLVQAVVPNPQRLLTDGQAIAVVIESSNPTEAIVIPQSALQIDQQGPFVLVVGADNRVEVKRIKTAQGPAGQVVVTEGLEVGQLIITEGSQRARPGQPVSPRPQEAPPSGAVPANAARGG